MPSVARPPARGYCGQSLRVEHRTSIGEPSEGDLTFFGRAASVLGVEQRASQNDDAARLHLAYHEAMFTLCGSVRSAVASARCPMTAGVVVPGRMPP